MWIRRYEPWAVARDILIKEKLSKNGLSIKSFKANLVYEPWNIKSKTGNPLKVFTPYKKALLNKGPLPEPIEIPKILPSPLIWPNGKNINDLELLDKFNWMEKFNVWDVGSDSAFKKLSSFKKNSLNSYGTKRDIPGEQGTSKLSPHLRFGEISPTQILNFINFDNTTKENNSLETYQSEIIWREFAHNLMWQFPEIHKKPIKKEFEDLNWDDNEELFLKWTKGLTGYPIVDAGMRELWSKGWMHNRVRMVTASFLTKHLLIPWQKGEEWFWDTLLDADAASNTASWQWVAGCGADAAPFFRIFNPIIQGEKFDPNGIYIRKYIPELKKMPNKFIHEPWKASDAILKNSDIRLGKTYPFPIIDHKFARERALNAYKNIRKEKDGN
jgi:deoxyribodipyrimidine photo-lyase